MKKASKRWGLVWDRWLSKARQRPRRRRPKPILESLESRLALHAPELAAIANQTVLDGTSTLVPLDGFDDEGDALTWEVTSSNPTISAGISSTNPLWKLSITHESDGGDDPAFSGDLLFELFVDRAPRAANRFIELTNQGFYNGITFHRVIDGFMSQGGDPTATGTGGSSLGDFDDQFDLLLQHTSSGLLSMAKGGDDSNDSQFFITDVPTRHLDFNHTIFGRLIEGEALRDQMNAVATPAKRTGRGDDKPYKNVTITSAQVITAGHPLFSQNRVLMLSAPHGSSGSAVVTVTVRDGSGGATTRQFTVNVGADMVNTAPFLADVPEIHTTMNAAAGFQLSGRDVEGNPITFGFTPPPPADNLQLVVDPSTGAGTVTPINNVLGVRGITVQTGSGSSADSQRVPVFIHPLAPTGLDLAAESDSGASNSDDSTRFNNANAGSRLKFTVSGTVSGVTVELYVGTTLIGEAPGVSGSTEVTTDGNFALGLGTHQIVARQTMRNLQVSVGNLQEQRTISSTDSAGFSLQVVPSEWRNAARPLDVNNDNSVVPLDALIIIDEINAHGSHVLGPAPPGTAQYIDVNGDGTVAPLDALMVIDDINARVGQLSALGDSQPLSGSGAAHDEALAALDVASVELSLESLFASPSKARRR